MKNREDWLCDQLDRDDISDATRAKYEAELDAIASHSTIRQSKEKAAATARKAYINELKAKILANDADFIQSFGHEEFSDDYELTQEGSDFIVYSKVCKDDQTHRRVHSTEQQAKDDLRYLYYNRLYDKYVRDGGELSNLKELV